ncbi:MAG: cell wall-active antibiotics response protein, partial [FCB group bacterium]|nr:cell wall-active antibiotics response protein [FCB group bacterium]
AIIDLRGEDITDMEGEIEVGLGSLDLILPADANIRIYVDDTFLSSVKIKGLRKEEQNEWISPEWKTGRPNLKFDLSVGLGSVDVELRD